MTEVKQTLEQAIKEHVELIAVNPRGLAEARVRAGQFLIMSTMLLDEQKIVKVMISKATTMANGAYADAMSAVSSDPKIKVTEAKAIAENNAEYVKFREALEEAQAEEKWISGYISIFNDAHLLYRQYSKQE